MRLATIIWDDLPIAALVEDDLVLPLLLDEPWLRTVRGIAGSGSDGLARVRSWAEAADPSAHRGLDEVELGPAIPDPGAIYTIGLNYRTPGEDGGEIPPRPLVYGKAASSVGAHRGTLRWDRSLTGNVDPEVELGVVIGATAAAVSPSDALRHVFGYTVINDVSSRDPWLDGDQWLVGKSMPGFCPVGPWVVTADALDPRDLRLACAIDGAAIQDDRTSSLRYSIAEVISHLSRHVTLRPGDLIATGTPARLTTPPGPDRHLEPGDVVTAWIEGIGELTTTIA
jgi:2-keto-4-pentenoate hydratase/2-oxohepta-3-ene-1,7-dioic acid hydratase in catechol pathway